VILAFCACEDYARGLVCWSWFCVDSACLWLISTHNPGIAARFVGFYVVDVVERRPTWTAKFPHADAVLRR
jgi:hypothetical protein